MPPSTTPYNHHSSGFTLIEILSMLIILGILAAIAVPRGGVDTSLRANTDILSSHLRYAQSRAMAMEEPWGIHATGGTYTMFKVSPPNTTVNISLPGGNEPGKGVDNGRWWFDAQGRPHSGDNTAPHATADISIKILDKEGAVIITAITGYIK